MVAVGLLAACSSSPEPEPDVTTTSVSTVVPTTSGAATGDPVVLAAGDIASCESTGDEATAPLVAARPNATVITLGDNVYDDGTARQFRDCYEPSWGPVKSRTRPSAGNHDYETPGASGYFGYFGAAAGEPGAGYYSYDVGAWHVIVLNSNCGDVSCSAGRAQEQWLRGDLAAANRACTLAYWHHPRFSSGTRHGSSATVAPFWQALYDGGADLVLTGHEHNYERLGPLTPAGALDEARGIRSFVVGTGGRSHYGFGRPITGSEVRNDDTYGVLQLTLKATSFDWQFLPEAGKTFTDAGSAPCH
ncbi:MAG: metallophosphoesterase family protein [Acidimicrobiales bacterium]